MKLKNLFEFFIQQGIAKDPRGSIRVKGLLDENKLKFEKLRDEEKEDFDKESLNNPYADSRILNGSGNEDVSSVLVGIDIESSEILLANTLKANGRHIDLVLTHHPEGHAYATFYQVMSMQADILNKFGVPINIAEYCTENRLKEVGRRVMAVNHTRAVDAAKLLGLPFMSAHTVADNQVTTYLQTLMDKKKPKYLEDAVKILKGIKEYSDASKIGAGPAILNGSKERSTGKIFVDMTGGTEGAKEILEKLAQSGVGTIIGMHMSEDHYKDVQKYHINVIIAGHIASDNLGVNLLLDAAEKKLGKLNVIECSGFKRIKHS
ncbi:MAG: NGG1p interacting factor NIF3 [Elusimicrobia bacterium]|nr:NGG1p interacting factor NIF3 [Candidatus Liberimonas magnetica]